MSGPLLLIGDLRGLAIETMETALELGYEPFNVIEGDRPRNPLCPVIKLSDLTAEQKGWPALIVGHRRYPDLANERLDRRWCEATHRVRVEMESLGISNWVSIIHPSSIVSPTATLGKGVAVGPSANISSYAVVGDFVNVGRSSSISHHCRIGDYSRLGPGVIIPGEVTIGSKVVVGPAATFVNYIHVTDGVLIGAGSVVTRHITRPVQVMGNPARQLRRPLAMVRKVAKKTVRRLLVNTRYFSRIRRWHQTGQW